MLIPPLPYLNIVRYPSRATNGFKPQLVPESDWPLWAKALKRLAKSEDKGIGDVVARIIGAENSEKFNKWHLATFGKPCGCKGKQARWNRMYPLQATGKS